MRNKKCEEEENETLRKQKGLPISGLAMKSEDLNNTIYTFHGHKNKSMFIIHIALPHVYLASCLGFDTVITFRPWFRYICYFRSNVCNLLFL